MLQVARAVLVLTPFLIGNWCPAQSPVTVTVDRSTPQGTSQYYSSFSQIDNSLDYPYGSNDGLAVTNARTLVAQGISFGNNHIMGWGVSDPWPSPTSATPTNWSGMDAHMLRIINAGCTPMITLCEAPWWMKGAYQSDGTTKLIPDINGDWLAHTYTNAFTDFRGSNYAAGYVSPDPYGCRILDSQMSKWLLMVSNTAARYMVAPYNVRHFQVWNELKGYWNPVLNRWAYENSAGNTNGYNAQHGYTYLYNQTYSKLTNVAASLGIAATNLFIGGPYPVISSGSASNIMSNPSAIHGPWGVLDKRPLDVISYWLTNKTGAGFVCMDGYNGNQFGTDITDVFTACEKFAAMNNWIRTQPGGATLPIVWSEWYSDSDTTGDDDFDNALGCYSAIQQLKSGASLTLLWGGQYSSATRPPLWTSTAQAGGGQATPWYYSYKALNDSFGYGTPFYATTQSSSNMAILASSLKTMLVNKTTNTITVNIDNTNFTLGRYEVKLVDVPPATPTGLSAMAGNARVILNWNTSSGATAYNLTRATSSGGPYTSIATVTGNSYTNTSLANGTTYYYSVAAIDAGGFSPFSAYVAATPQAITLIKDDADASGITITGAWTSSTSTTGYYGGDYLHDGNTGTTGGKSVKFTPTITVTGYYDVYARWSASSNRATNTPIDVHHATGTATFTENQQLNGGSWVWLGTFKFNSGTAGYALVRNDAANGYVIADAFEFVLK